MGARDTKGQRALRSDDEVTNAALSKMVKHQNEYREEEEGESEKDK